MRSSSAAIVFSLANLAGIFERGCIVAASPNCLRSSKSNILLRMSTRPDTKPMQYENFRSLKPLPCVGTYNHESGMKYSSMYIGPEQMMVQERVDGKCIVKGIVPLVVRPELESAIVSAMKVSITERSLIFKSWSGSIITDRDGGLYDNLSNIFTWNSKYRAKREIYEALRLKGSCESPYHGIVAALDKFADLKITGLLLEVADRPGTYSVSLGAAILVTKNEYFPGKKWKMSSSRARDIIKSQRGSSEAKLVKCYLDELLGIAFATGIPIVMTDTVYESVSVDGLLEKSKSENGKILLNAPHFTSEEEVRSWRAEKRLQAQQEEAKRKRSAKIVPKAMEIKDASAYLSMRTSEKRACLRATGVMELPRPREGPRAVDAMMIPLLDEEVAYEVMRRLAETKGDFAQAAEMEDFESRKPRLAREINEARKRGDYDSAKRLCDELNALSTLRFDPTNPEGMIAAQEFDVEEWYYEARKRVYGIIM